MIKKRKEKETKITKVFSQGLVSHKEMSKWVMLVKLKVLCVLRQFGEGRYSVEESFSESS